MISQSLRRSTGYRTGVYVEDIAAELGVHPRTVSRARKRGDAPQRLSTPVEF